jgi:hypothetical protein
MMILPLHLPRHFIHSIQKSSSKMKKRPIVQKIMAANQVTIKDWLAMKPYDAPVHNYDIFYVKQCQTVYGYFMDNGYLFQQWELSRQQIKELSCQIVSYFEDYIVEIGIWRTFIETNKELYGYCLPFYDLSEYDETYINIEDIAFLIWHYVTKYSEEEYIVNPDHDVIMELSEKIFDLFENVMEQAPAIDLYDNIFNIKEDENYFVFKTKMKWFSTESYLIGVDLGKKYQALQEELAEEGRKAKWKIEHLNIVLYSLIEKFLYQKRSSFSALNGPEWFAKIAKCSDTRRQEILDLTYWIDGKFFIKERSDKYFVFEHLLTKTHYKARTDSFQKNKDMRPSETMAYNMHLIRWHKEYLLSGMMYGEPMTEKDIKSYKTARLETPWILTEKTLEFMNESTNNMNEAFMEFFGSPLAVFDTSAQLQKANMDYLDYQRNKIILNNKDVTTESVQEKIKKFRDISGKGDWDMDTPFKKDENKRSFGLFFIKNVGSYTCEGIKETIHDLKARSLNGQERADLFVSFANGYIPPLCTYLLEQYGAKNLKYPTLDNDMDVVKYLPFFWRMNSPEEFDRVYPMMTLVDQGDLD